MPRSHRLPLAVPPSYEAVLSAPLTAPAVPAAKVVGEDDVRFMRGDRAYRVRGLGRNLSAEFLKVMLRVSSGERLYLDTLDLYQARHRRQRRADSAVVGAQAGTASVGSGCDAVLCTRGGGIA